MDWQVFAMVGLVGFFVLAGLIFWVMFRTTSPTRRPGDEAKGILENRYALGEIDDEEFAHRMSVLKEERQRLRAEGG